MKKHPILLPLLALLLLLPGCTAEDRERIAENDRIYALAKREAAPLARAYIAEKYALEADVLGYDVDGSDIFMGYRARPLVTVALTDGKREFLAYLSLESPTVRWDNYQKAEAAACLESVLLSRLGRPAPAESQLEYRLRGDPSPGQAQINGETYPVTGMLNFRYEGQTAEELLDRMSSLDYEGRWLGGEEPLEETDLTPARWPEGVDLHLMLKRYRDGESYAAYRPQRLASGAGEPSVQENPALLETLALTLRDGTAERTWACFDRYEAEGLCFVGRATVRGEAGAALPAPGWVAGQVTFPQTPVLWPAGEKGGAQCGPLFCCTEPAGEEGVEYAISCTVLPEFFERHGSLLYYGVRSADGSLRVYDSLPLRPGHPGSYEPGNVYIRQTLWVGSPAEEPAWYAFLKREP